MQVASNNESSALPNIASMVQRAKVLLRNSPQLADIQDETADVMALLAHTCAIDSAGLYAHPEQVLAAADHDRFVAAIDLRAAGMPVAYITGQRGFHALDLQVDERVLIPRPETELLVEAVLARAPKSTFTVLDLGTGSGAIGLAIAAASQNARITATDISPQAIEVAADNARTMKLAPTFKVSDWYAALDTQLFDFIVCNPPYIRSDDPHLRHLHAEPRLALDGGPDGLRDIRVVMQRAAEFLAPAGRLFLEHGFDQSAAVAEIVRAARLQVDVLLIDAGGQDRVTIVRHAQA